MLDNRKALKCGFRLELNTEQICIIDEEIGRGAASIVYGGHYLDSMGQCHCVRIKECYPCWTAVNRLDDGKLSEAEDNVKIAVLAHTARSTRAILPKQESHLAGWLN